jgi:hypothetical protein
LKTAEAAFKPGQQLNGKRVAGAHRLQEAHSANGNGNDSDMQGQQLMSEQSTINC